MYDVSSRQACDIETGLKSPISQKAGFGSLCHGLARFVTWLMAMAVCPASMAGLVSEFNATLWQTQDGLPNDQVLAITQSRDGYLWVGTREGLARFDGIKFSPLKI